MPRKKKVSDSEEDFVVYDKTVTPKARQTRAKTGAKPVSVIELLNSTDSEEEIPKSKSKAKTKEKKLPAKKKVKKGSSEDYDIDGESDEANASSLEIESSDGDEIDAIDEKITRSKSTANPTKTDSPKKRAAALKNKAIDESSSETAAFGESEDDYSESEKTANKKPKKVLSPKKKNPKEKKTGKNGADNSNRNSNTVVEVEKMEVEVIGAKVQTVNNVEKSEGVTTVSSVTVSSTVLLVPDTVQAIVPDRDNVVSLIEKKPESVPIVIEDKPKNERKTLTAKSKGTEAVKGSEKKGEIEKPDAVRKRSNGENGKKLPQNTEVSESSKKRQLSDEKKDMATIVRESAKGTAMESDSSEKPTKKKFYRANSTGAAVVPLAGLSKPIVIPRDPVPLNISSGGDSVRRVGLSKKKNVKPLHPPVK